ncbi:hypothetical protein BKA66DRAFT_516742 [Pyrenochaeta sp. MPI-SDFR-AT-0127]|nr:hypothetical protein BKA66DRAFT_516742 [Pyrenochaeta sp. MPI-SDFR-AT-0127]
MARFRPVEPPSHKPEQPPMRARHNPPAQDEGFGEDPWALFTGRSIARPSTAKSSCAVDATVKEDAEQVAIALPIPIASPTPLGKIVTADGRELPYYQEIPGFVYQPVAGFEHCFTAQSLAQGAPSPYRSPTTAQAPTRPLLAQAPDQAPLPCAADHPSTGAGMPQSHAAYMQSVNESPRVRVAGSRVAQSVPVTTPRAAKRKAHKRSRFVARPQYTTAQYPSEDEDDAECDDEDVRVLTEESYSFYIGDFIEVMKFFRRRFDELTMKPVRSMVTAWIKQLEPRRLSVYGPYHKQLPSEHPPECTPPWWPRDVPYNEPSHLSKEHLLTLAVDITVQHRAIDQVKRKGSWVAKLRQAAQYAVETTPPEYFSSSKSPTFNVEMRERALELILPTLFDVAQSYEDHLAQYNLYEDTDTVDPGTGRYHTWHAITRPSRQTTQRKRARRNKIVQAPTATADCDFDESGDETEVDDTVSNSFLRRRQNHARKQARISHEANNVAASRQQVPEMTANTPTTATTTTAISRPSPAAAQQDYRSNPPNPSPNNSFDQSMNGLNLGEGMEMDVKGGVPQYNEQAMLHNVYTMSQPMHYSVSHPGYANQVFHPQDNGNHFTNSSQPFTHGPVPGYVEPYPMLNTSFPPQTSNSAFDSSMASTNATFPYDYDGVFPNTSAATHTNRSFHGLPNVFDVDGHQN